MTQEQAYDDAIEKAMRLIAERNLPPLEVITPDEKVDLACLVAYIIELSGVYTEVELLKKVHGILMIAYLMGYQNAMEDVE